MVSHGDFLTATSHHVTPGADRHVVNRLYCTLFLISGLQRTVCCIRIVVYVGVIMENACVSN